MALQIPQGRRPVRQIQVEKKRVPIEQIVAVKGQSLGAKGIEAAGNVIGQALQRRAELRQQGLELARQQEQTKQIARALGVDDQDFSTLSPDQAVTVGKYVNEQRRREESTPRIRLLEKQGGFKEGELGDDYDVAKTIFTQNAITKRMMENPNVARRDAALSLQKDRVQQSIVDKFNADPVVRKQTQSIAAASSVRDLVNSNNPIAASAIPTYMARASGEVGNLSEPDKAPFGGSQAILARLEAALTQKATGRLTRDNAEFLLQLSDVMERSAANNLDRIARERAGQYSKTSKSLNQDDLYNTLRPTLGPLQPLPPPTKSGNIKILGVRERR